MKLCVECKFFGGGDLCLYPQKDQINPVTGSQRGARWCSIERTWSTQDSCAPEGRWFQPLPEPAMAA